MRLEANILGNIKISALEGGNAHLHWSVSIDQCMNLHDILQDDMEAEAWVFGEVC